MKKKSKLIMHLCPRLLASESHPIPKVVVINSQMCAIREEINHRIFGNIIFMDFFHDGSGLFIY